MSAAVQSATSPEPNRRVPGSGSAPPVPSSLDCGAFDSCRHEHRLHSSPVNRLVRPASRICRGHVLHTPQDFPDDNRTANFGADTTQASLIPNAQAETAWTHSWSEQVSVFWEHPRTVSQSLDMNKDRRVAGELRGLRGGACPCSADDSCGQAADARFLRSTSGAG